MTRFWSKALTFCIATGVILSAIAFYRWVNRLPITLDALLGPLGFLIFIALVTAPFKRRECGGWRPDVVRRSDFWGHLLLAVLLIPGAVVPGLIIIDALGTGVVSLPLSSSAKPGFGDNMAGFLVTLAWLGCLLFYVLLQIFVSILQVRKYLGGRKGAAGA